MSLKVIDVAVVVTILVISYGCLRRLWHQQNRLPPGPKAREIGIASLQTKPWLTYTAWRKSYGPIVYYSLFGTKTIILNSGKVAVDLLESRSSIYSDRMPTWMSGELGGRKLNVFAISSAHPRFRIYRRLLRSGLNPGSTRDYRPILTHETQILLKDLANSPGEFMHSIRRNAVAVIVKLAYGYEVGGYDDEFVKIIEEGFMASMDLHTPGRYMVEMFPILRFLPQWFPGAGFKRHAKRLGEKLSRLDSIPFEWARKQVSTGTYIESFTSKQLRKESRYINPEEKEDIIKWCSAGLYTGGSDTTVSALVTFIMLMQLYPEVLKRAQSDIDCIAVGRLPTLDDYDSLPYVVAIIREVIRWGPVAPLGLPHRVTEDDAYDGYWIPKGSKVVANIWAITHDEELYPDPFKFDPERHLGDHHQPDPFKYVFGFGRRVCPGAHFAEMSLFLNITNIVALFDITKARNSDGTEVEPSISWSTGITSHLDPFPCQISLRSPDLFSTML